jgi:hypothetical protein
LREEGRGKREEGRGKREDDYEHTIYWKKIDGLYFSNK